MTTVAIEVRNVAKTLLLHLLELLFQFLGFRECREIEIGRKLFCC